MCEIDYFNLLYSFEEYRGIIISKLKNKLCVKT